jgi:hypothetical protein
MKRRDPTTDPKDLSSLAWANVWVDPMPSGSGDHGIEQAAVGVPTLERRLLDLDASITRELRHPGIRFDA